MEQNPQFPFSKEAEMYVLGSILIEPDLANEYCGRLSIDDFYNEQNKTVFSAIETLYKQKRDTNVINVIEALKASGKYASIKEEYLFELTDSVPSIVTTETYVDVLKEKSLERELFNEADNIRKEVLNGKEQIGDILAKTEKNIGDIINKQKVASLKPISVALEGVFEAINNNKNKEGGLIGLDTGYKPLNEYTFGFQPGQLIILAARPGVGKSALALNIAAKMASKCNAHVAFFSLEMGIDQLVMRLLSMTSNVKLGKILTGDMTEDEATRLLSGKVQLDNLNIYFDETMANNLEDIKVQCRKLKREGRLDFIVIDYLQLLSMRKGNTSRYEEVSNISRTLKMIARELEVPVLALSQLSRDVEKRGKNQDGTPTANNKPVLSDLRESGSIEQDADIVLFIHSDVLPSEDVTKNKSSRKVEIIVAKNRQSMTGSFPMLFRGDCSSFEVFTKKDNKNNE